MTHLQKIQTILEMLEIFKTNPENDLEWVKGELEELISEELLKQ